MAKNCWRLLEPQKVVPKAKSCRSTTTNTTILLFTVFRGTKEKKKMRIQETVQNEMIEIAFLLTIIVCNSQGSKAFELATAYVQVKKGPK